jgi:hypothetical protein
MEYGPLEKRHDFTLPSYRHISPQVRFYADGVFGELKEINQYIKLSN